MDSVLSHLSCEKANHPVSAKCELINCLYPTRTLKYTNIYLLAAKACERMIGMTTAVNAIDWHTSFHTDTVRLSL